MKITETSLGKFIIAKKGYKVRRIGTTTPFQMCSLLPNETQADFEELSDEELQAEEATAKYNEEYANLVEQKVREKYSVSAELAILRQRDTKQEEFEAYNTYVEQCKATAKSELK